MNKKQETVREFIATSEQYLRWREQGKEKDEGAQGEHDAISAVTKQEALQLAVYLEAASVGIDPTQFTCQTKLVRALIDEHVKNALNPETSHRARQLIYKGINIATNKPARLDQEPENERSKALGTVWVQEAEYLRTEHGALTS